MAHSAHKILSDISEHKRDIESVTLKQLINYRSKLVETIKQSSIQLEILRVQRSKKISRGMPASELVLLEDSVIEHEQHIEIVKGEIATLDSRLKEQKKKWSQQHKQHKTHEKMHNKLKKKAEVMMAHKLQMMQDDQFASQLPRRLRVY